MTDVRWTWDQNGEYWECSGCNNDFSLTEGSPNENSYAYCPTCGGKIVESVVLGIEGAKCAETQEALISTLRAENARLQAENARLQKMHIISREDGYWLVINGENRAMIQIHLGSHGPIVSAALEEGKENGK